MRKKKAGAFITISLVCMLLLAACGGAAQGTTGTESTTQSIEKNDTEQAATPESEGEQDGKQQSTDQESTPFGEFKSQTLDGEEVTQELFTKADLTMVNIWGTFCGPCIREMPELGELNKEYADQGFQIVGIISDVSTAGDEMAQKIIDETKADYTHMILSEDLFNGIVGETQVVPTTIFVDSNGNQIGSTYAGAKDKDGWKEIIEQLLEEVKK